MKPPPDRCPIATSRRFSGASFSGWCLGLLLVGGGLVCVPARAQFSPPVQNLTRSISGLFIVQRTAPLSWLATTSRVLADTNLVRLEPALLAISAERLKTTLWSRLDIPADAPRHGLIYLVIRPARSPDENVTIIARSSAQGWDYRVELPDVLTQTRLARALTGVLLQEYANRNAKSRAAEIPAWLTDGLSQELIEAGLSKFSLSVPEKVVNDVPVTRFSQAEKGLDRLAAARQTLKNSPALTFEQLSWPTPAQLAGDDGGVYRASAQLLVNALLKRNNGPARLRALLETLPRFYNWQTAFHAVFRTDFPEPLDLEKWWALQVITFAAHDHGSRWTPSVSRQRLDEILLVPVETRTASNSLPIHAEISFQTAIRSLDAARQKAVFQTKLRDLGVAQLRMAPALAGLTDEYRRALTAYLGNHPNKPPLKSKVRVTLKKLDALDARRRVLGAGIKPEVPVLPARVPQN